jgi:PAS domain S-box-containing protein
MSEDRFRTMADGVPLIIWVHDAEGRQQFVNETFREFFGIPNASELTPEEWRTMVHPDDADHYIGEFLACIREQRPFHAETRVRNTGGTWRVLESWGRPRYGKHQEFLGIVGVSADITERRKAEEKLRNVDRRKDEFLAMLSHELRNPLASISTSLAIVRRVSTNAVVDKVIGIAERQASVLQRLVDELLDSSSVTEGKVKLSRDTVALEEVLAVAAETCRPHIHERGHNFVIDISDATLTVEGDRVRLVQVVTNLLQNASKFTPPNGTITLSLEREGDAAIIKVADTGAGIAPENVDAIFEMFTQPASECDPKDRGLGLGLAIVKRLVELHGGTVRGDSKGAGLGSEFVVRLPISPGVQVI